MASELLHAELKTFMDMDGAGVNKEDLSPVTSKAELSYCLK